MNNQEILQKIEQDKVVYDEHENKLRRFGIVFSFSVGLAVTIIMISAESILTGTIDYGKPAVVFSIVLASELFEYIRIKNKKKIKDIISIIGTIILLAICLYYYIGGLVK